MVGSRLVGTNRSKGTINRRTMNQYKEIEKHICVYIVLFIEVYRKYIMKLGKILTDITEVNRLIESRQHKPKVYVINDMIFSKGTVTDGNYKS